jgi:formate-dependent nitrite reductase membrane component NrfD
MIETTTAESRDITPVASAPSAFPQKSYYGLPFLKRPTWGWEIALYFFLGGISAGAFVLATMADLFGGNRHRDLVRKARYLSLGTLLPCPALLAADLGRPARFSHMLRVFKPQSPMNTGAWALFAYGQLAGLLAVLQSRKLLPVPAQTNVERGLSLAAQPFALTILAYPGVLLSTTSTPIWANRGFLGPLIAMSSFSAACDSLALVATHRSRTSAALDTVGRISRITEGGLLAAYTRQAGETGAPLTRGRQAPLFWAFVVGAGLILPELLRSQTRKTGSRKTSLLGTVLSLAGGLALKWIVVHSGRESASDAAANRAVSRRAA